MSLGTNLALCRRYLGLSQAELADALNVSRQAISKWELDASVPSGENLVRLRELFGVSVDHLIDGLPAPLPLQSIQPPPAPEPLPPEPAAPEPLSPEPAAPGPAAHIRPWLLGLATGLLAAALAVLVLMWVFHEPRIVDQDDLPVDYVDITSAEYAPLNPIP